MARVMPQSTGTGDCFERFTPQNARHMSRPVEELLRIAAFADALPAAIWVGRAPSGETLYVNREFERVLGISPPTDASRGNYVGPYGVHLPDGQKYPEDQMP